MAEKLTKIERLERDLIGRVLQRGVTPEQINKRDGGLQRQAEVREIDQSERTVDLAFSSEAEVERWFGIEVLDHSPGAMRTERLNNGAAVLVDHDRRDHVGVVESIEVGADRKARAKVRFGKGARASEIFQDVVDGIRRHVSVAYMVHKVEIEERKGQPDLVRLTDWEPYEISLVSVPADTTVGVGRGLDTSPEESGADDPNNGGQPQRQAERKNSSEESEMKVKNIRDDKGDLVRAEVDEDGNIVKVLEVLERAADKGDKGDKADKPDAAAERRKGSEVERERVRSIVEMGEQYEAADLARDAVKEGKSVEEFRAALLDHLNKQRTKPLDDEDGADIGMSPAEARKFSFLRALRALANPTDRRAQEGAQFEFEASRAAAEHLGKEPEGLLVPMDVLRTALMDGQRAPFSTGTSGGAASGGYAVENPLMTASFIEMLRNRTVAMQLGTSMTGLVGNPDIPRQIAGATGYWIGEDDDAVEGNQELDQIGLRPKTVAAYSEITRRLLMQSSLDVEALVRRDLAAALGLTVDKAAFYGSGSDAQPQGIASTDGINAVDFAANNPTYAEIVEMESEIAADNADVNNMAYVLNAMMRGHFKTTEKFDGTNGMPVWEQGNTLNGYRTEVTNQITTGDLFFGNFADLILGMWGGLELTIDPYTHSLKGRLRIVAMQDVDVVLRRVESFCLGRNSA